MVQGGQQRPAVDIGRSCPSADNATTPRELIKRRLSTGPSGRIISQRPGRVARGKRGCPRGRKSYRLRAEGGRLGQEKNGGGGRFTTPRQAGSVSTPERCCDKLQVTRPAQYESAGTVRPPTALSVSQVGCTNPGRAVGDIDRKRGFRHHSG